MVGASTIRVHELGRNDVDPTPEQLARMRALVRQAMDEGAMGVGSSLIYVPAVYAETDELVALASEAGRCGGMYISHMRSESSRLLEAIDELVEIGRRSGARAEIYHLKAAGRSNWPLMDPALARIEAARAAGVPVTANMYLYAASGTGLDSTLPFWVREGGPQGDARSGSRTRRFAPGSSPTCKAARATGRRCSRSASPIRRFASMPASACRRSRRFAARASRRRRSTSSSRTAARSAPIFHSISEDNIRKVLARPWVSFGSDAAAIATEPPFTDKEVHPRAYGNFARLLGRYVRDEKALGLAEAVRRLTSLPADNLRIADRGRLRRGFHADLAIFDPAKIADRATYERPHQYAVGMRHVFVNGVAVLKRRRAYAARSRDGSCAGRAWRKCK